MSETKDSGRRPWFGGSLRRLGDSVLGLVETRLQILALEWAEERANLIRMLMVVFVILWCLHLSIVLGLVYLLMVVGDENRVTVLGIAALALLLTATGSALALRAWLKRRRPMFATTISELRKEPGVDPGQAVMSSVQDQLDARRAELVARAAVEREALAGMLSPLGTLDRGLERLEAMKLNLPTTALGTGLALSALLLAMPAGRSPIVRGAIAMIQLATSVKRLFTRG